MAGENKEPQAPSAEHYQNVVNILTGKIGMLTTENVSKDVIISTQQKKIEEYEKILGEFKPLEVGKA